MFLIVGGYTGDLAIKPHITRDDLISVKNKSFDYIIDLDTKKYFDPEKNEWVEISEI